MVPLSNQETKARLDHNPPLPAGHLNEKTEEHSERYWPGMTKDGTRYTISRGHYGVTEMPIPTGEHPADMYLHVEITGNLGPRFDHVNQRNIGRNTGVYQCLHFAGIGHCQVNSSDTI